MLPSYFVGSLSETCLGVSPATVRCTVAGLAEVRHDGRKEDLDGGNWRTETVRDCIATGHRLAHIITGAARLEAGDASAAAGLSGAARNAKERIALRAVRHGRGDGQDGQDGGDRGTVVGQRKARHDGVCEAAHALVTAREVASGVAARETSAFRPQARLASDQTLTTKDNGLCESFSTTRYLVANSYLKNYL